MFFYRVDYLWGIKASQSDQKLAWVYNKFEKKIMMEKLPKKKLMMLKIFKKNGLKYYFKKKSGQKL